MFAVNGRLRRSLRKAPHAAVAAGLPPAALGWRWTEKRPLDAASVAAAGGEYRVLAPERRERNDLPLGDDLSRLCADAGWWGYSFADVPSRLSGETGWARLPGAVLAFHRDEASDLHIGLLGRDGTALETREIDFRAHHARPMREMTPIDGGEGLWICERVYDNHSHWLTAHLPKLALAKSLGIEDRLILPEKRTAVMDETLALAGIDPGRLRSLPTEAPIRFSSLELFRTDRFRPDLLRAGAALVRQPVAGAPGRRVYVSRRKARARRLHDEDEIFRLFSDAGFERVDFEEMSFSEQRALLAETEILAGPHGAGLTNQMMMPEGGTVIEIADPAYPNPNFYALAAALGHRYALVRAKSVGEGHLLFQDLSVEEEAVRRALRLALPEEARS